MENILENESMGTLLTLMNTMNTAKLSVMITHKFDHLRKAYQETLEYLRTLNCTVTQLKKQEPKRDNDRDKSMP